MVDGVGPKARAPRAGHAVAPAPSARTEAPPPTPGTAAPASPRAKETAYDGKAPAHRLMEVKADVARGQPAADKALSRDVQSNRSHVGARGRDAPVRQASAAAAPPPPSDPDVAASLGRIKRESATSLNVGPVVQEEILKLDPDQRKELVAHLPRDIRTRLDREIYEGSPIVGEVHVAMLDNMNPAAQGRALEKMTDENLKRVAAASRAGNVTEPALQTSISIEMAARTQWGANDPATVAHLKKLNGEGRITVAEGTGQARTLANGDIQLDPSVLKSPERAAAILAHEGVHSNHAAHGGMDESTYKEETAGNLASAMVWKELGDRKDPAVPAKALDTLNDYATLYEKHGVGGVSARVAGEYANEAAESYKRSKRASERATDSTQRSAHAADAEAYRKRPGEIARELAGDRDAQAALTPQQFSYVANAVFEAGASTADVENMGRALKNASRATRDEVMKDMKRAMDPETYKVFTRAMN